MPGKMSQISPSTTVRAARAAGSRPHLASVLPGRPEKRKYSRQFGSHPERRVECFPPRQLGLYSKFFRASLTERHARFCICHRAGSTRHQRHMMCRSAHALSALLDGPSMCSCAKLLNLSPSVANTTRSSDPLTAGTNVVSASCAEVKLTSWPAACSTLSTAKWPPPTVPSNNYSITSSARASSVGGISRAPASRG